MLDALFLREWGQDHLLGSVLYLEDFHLLWGRIRLSKPKEQF